MITAIQRFSARFAMIVVLAALFGSQTWFSPSATAACLDGQSAKACSQPTISVGVNAFFPQWPEHGMTYAEFRLNEQQLLDQLQATSVKVIRTSLNVGSALFFYPTPDQKAPGYIYDAYQRGITTILVLGIGVSNYNPAPGCPRPGNPWPSQCLSAADPEKLNNSDKFINSALLQLDAIESQGVKLHALEVMTEFNWSNGDFNTGINGKGRYLTLADLENANDPEAKKVAAGYLVYLNLVKVFKSWRDHSKLNRATPLISGGLAGGWLESGVSPRNDTTSIKTTLQFLRNHGLDDLVDGYGVHNYPVPDLKISLVDRIATLKTYVFPLCSTIKPCWLTEWGFLTQPSPCPLGEGKAIDARNVGLVSVMRQAFKPFIDRGILTNIIYFDWLYVPASAGGNAGGFGIYGQFPSCGADSQAGTIKSGRLALLPF